MVSLVFISTFAALMLNGGEFAGWVRKMMGRESLRMILERYYSRIKNYERRRPGVHGKGLQAEPEPPEAGGGESKRKVSKLDY